MFVGGVSWRCVIVVCAAVIGGTLIIRSRIVRISTVGSRTVGIGPWAVVIAIIGSDRAYDGAGGKPTYDTDGSRSAVAMTIVSSTTIAIATTIITHIGDQIRQ